MNEDVEQTAEETIEQNAREIEWLFKRVDWYTEYNGHDVIGRCEPQPGDPTHFGIVALESVVWDWHNRSLGETELANFQIFRVEEVVQTAIWTRREVSPSRAKELLDRYGIPMHEADRTRKLVPENEEIVRTIDLQHRVSGYGEIVRDLEASG
jgi:hypothetical protein